MSGVPLNYEQRYLENDLVALEPFDPTIHVAFFVETINTHPELFTYISFPVIKTEADFMSEFYNKYIRLSPEEYLYAVIDKSSVPGVEEKLPGKYAGIASLSGLNKDNAVAEIGAIIYPSFQRTHVATNAIGLLLLYTLDPHSAGGLGLRRVEWKCHAGNEASRRTALRMGFEFEGITRWHRVFPRGTVGLPVEALEKRNGTKGEHLGRHTANFSIVWEEWDEKRPKIVAQMKRNQQKLGIRTG